MDDNNYPAFIASVTIQDIARTIQDSLEYNLKVLRVLVQQYRNCRFQSAYLHEHIDASVQPLRILLDRAETALSAIPIDRHHLFDANIALTRSLMEKHIKDCKNLVETTISTQSERTMP